jgi:hypothetical protein
MIQNVESIGFETGYKVFAVVDYARRRGGQKPVERDGRWYTELVGKTWFGDGQGLAWRGRLLLGDDELAEADKHSLRAEVSGPILGIARNWDGYWGPWGVTPRLHPGENTVTRGHGQVALFEAKRAFEAYLAQAGSPWDEVPLGMRFAPGMTGDQQDFGATKLAPALAPPAGGAFHLWECAFATLYEACRPTHYYEANAQRIRIDDHPQCVFWDQRPHWHTGVSPDRLGKTSDQPFRYQSSPPSAPGAPPRPEQILGKDFQHASSNTLCGYALLSGSWLDRELCAHEIEAHLLGQRIDRGREAERGIGRALLQVAWLWLVTGDERLIENERKRLEVHYNDFLDPGRKDWQVRVLTTIKDNRKLDGKYDCWMPWQTALCGIGLDAAGQIGLTKAFEINKILMRTLVFYGWWETPKGWGVGDAVRYLTGPEEGKALSAEAYRDESQASPHFGTGFHEWSWPAVIIARRYAQEAGDQAWLDRCDRILAALRRDYVSTPPKGFDRVSEWTAVR